MSANYKCQGLEIWDMEKNDYEMENECGWPHLKCQYYRKLLYLMFYSNAFPAVTRPIKFCSCLILFQFEKKLA